MNAQSWLGGILVVQLLAAVGLFWGDWQARTQDITEPLLDFDISRVDRIVIDDNVGNTATLQKDGDMWMLPELEGLPGNQSRIQGLHTTLEGLETGYPVATQESSKTRFEVAEDVFQRRLRLYSGEEMLGEYYFGTAPAMGETHGRRAGEDAIYSLGINNYDMPGDNNDWMDKTLISVSDPVEISGPGYTLQKDGENWDLVSAGSGGEGSGAGDATTAPSGGEAGSGEGGQETGQLQQGEVEQLVSTLNNLRVLRVAEEQPENEPVSLTVNTGDSNWTYEFMEGEEAGDYFVRRNDVDTLFTMSQTSYQRLAQMDRARLLGIEEEEPASTEGGEDSEEQSAGQGPQPSAEGGGEAVEAAPGQASDAGA